MSDAEVRRHIAIDSEDLAGRRFPYQEDMSLIEDVDLLEATPGEDINWLEDITLLKVLVKHLQSGNSYGIRLKERHCKFPQPELGPWVEGSPTVGEAWRPSVLEGWEPPLH